MSQPIATLFALVGTLAASSALAQNSVVGACPPGMRGQCVWSECAQTSNGVQCTKYAPLTPPTVLAQPVATMAPVSVPAQQVAPAVNCPGNACLDPDAGKFCGIHWCVWLLGGAILFGSVVLYFIMSRIQRGHLVGELRGHMRHWSLLVDDHGAPLPGVSRTVLIEVARAIESTRGDINANDFLRDLRLSQNGRTAIDDDAILRGFPGTPGNTAAGTTP